MRLLELFAGTGSVGNAFDKLGWEVVSLDIEPGHTIQADIMSWHYDVYPPGHFDCVHASPPCTEYSRAKTTGVRKLELADGILQRTLDIVAYFKPRVFILENPHTGMMKDRPAMADMTPFLRVVTYCKYGAPYRKATAIWTNLGHHWSPRPACCKASPCEGVLDWRHPQTAQLAPGKVGGVRRASASDSFRREQLYALPAVLCEELAQAATNARSSWPLG